MGTDLTLDEVLEKAEKISTVEEAVEMIKAAVNN